MEQRTPEWFEIKKGKAGASSFDKILTPTGKRSASAIPLMRKLARQSVIADPMDFQGNKFTEWGNDHEDEARRLYESIKGVEVEQRGWVQSNFSEFVGCSPDGMGLEIKCPMVDTHVSYLMAGELPKDYKLQVHGSMVVCERDSWDFMSYFPGLQPFILEVKRDEFTDKVEAGLKEFASEFEAVRQDIIDAITMPEVF